MIIFDDADLEQAVKWAHIGIMSNQDQICTASSRLLVQDTIIDRFLPQFLRQVEDETPIGTQFAENTVHGPQVNRAQHDRVLSFIQSGKQEGATVALGGEAYRPANGKGYFVRPTVFTDVTEDMTIYKEEIFGPVVVICSFSDEQDALRMANDTPYGLGGSIFTQNLPRAHRTARKIQAGSVWINSTIDGDIRAPFGGYKQSGIGNELGKAGLDAYLSVKSVYVNLGLML